MFENPLNKVSRDMAATQRKFESYQKAIAEEREREIARQERTNELLEINGLQNDTMIELKRTEVEFLQNIDGNTAALVELLSDLELTNRALGSINHDDMIEIQRRLDEIVKNGTPKNIRELLLDEVKKQIADKGVNSGVQLLIIGIKKLIIGV